MILSLHHQQRPAALVVAGLSRKCQGDSPSTATFALIPTLTGVPIYGGVCGVPRRALGRPKASDLRDPTSNGFRLSCTLWVRSARILRQAHKAIAPAVILR